MKSALFAGTLSLSWSGSGVPDSRYMNEWMLLNAEISRVEWLGRAGGLGRRYHLTLGVIACELRPHPAGPVRAVKTAGCKRLPVRLAAGEECQDIWDWVFLLYKNTNKAPLDVYAAQWVGKG